jgi:hypothetical protein
VRHKVKMEFTKKTAGFRKKERTIVDIFLTLSKDQMMKGTIFKPVMEL